MTVFYTSDHHFSHRSIMHYEDHRTVYPSLEAMNEDLIDRWNHQVGKLDHVYHLGDFCFGGPPNWQQVLDRLNGNITLIKGNHDRSKSIKKVAHYFEDIQWMTRVRRHGMEWFLSHFPMEVDNRHHLFSIHGHRHGYGSRLSHQVNVGIDSQVTDRLVGRGWMIPEDLLVEHCLAVNEQTMEELAATMES